MNVNPYYNDADVSADRTAAQEQKSGISVAAFILSIISIVSCLFFINIPFAVVSIILAAVVLVKKYGKKYLSVASVVISSLSLAISVILLIVMMPVLTIISDLSKDIEKLYGDENYKEIVEDFKRTGELPENFEKYSDGESGEFFDKYCGGFDNFFDIIIHIY